MQFFLLATKSVAVFDYCVGFFHTSVLLHKHNKILGHCCGVGCFSLGARRKPCPFGQKPQNEFVLVRYGISCLQEAEFKALFGSDNRISQPYFCFPSRLHSLWALKPQVKIHMGSNFLSAYYLFFFLRLKTKKK